MAPDVPGPPSAGRRLDGPRAAPLVTAAVGLGCAVGAAVTTGGRGVLAAAIGTAVVTGFFWAGLLPLLVMRGQEARAAFGLALLLVNYTLRLAVGLLLLVVLSRAAAVDSRWLGLTIICCALAWVGAQVALVGRSRATL